MHKIENDTKVYYNISSKGQTGLFFEENIPQEFARYYLGCSLEFIKKYEKPSTNMAELSHHVRNKMSGSALEYALKEGDKSTETTIVEIIGGVKTVLSFQEFFKRTKGFNEVPDIETTPYRLLNKGNRVRHKVRPLERNRLLMKAVMKYQLSLAGMHTIDSARFSVKRMSETTSTKTTSKRSWKYYRKTQHKEVG